VGEAWWAGREKVLHVAAGKRKEEEDETDEERMENNIEEWKVEGDARAVKVPDTSYRILRTFCCYVPSSCPDLGQHEIIRVVCSYGQYLREPAEGDTGWRVALKAHGSVRKVLYFMRCIQHQ
jgi:hypothetical protein